MKHELICEAEALQPQLVQWRRDLHQIPELRLQLPQTVAYVRARLDEMGVNYRVYEDLSCIEALIGSGEPCYMLRSDMDGLPMAEETDLPYRSTNGCMHSCGHDLHTTILLGAAKLLKAHESELKGTVKLFFQSGEEQVEGAKAAIEAGILENPKVDAVFAIHVIAMAPAGMLMTGKQPMSSVYNFRITLTGHGGHGSAPQTCIDPINAGVQVYLALQSLLAREVASSDEAVLTIGKFTAGDISNVIPETCELAGTLRTFDRKVRDHIVERFNEIVPAVAAAYRCKCQIDVLGDCPSVINDDEVTDSAERSIEALLPETKVIRGMRGTGSEDFAYLSERVPGSYYILGAGVEDKAQWLGQHNPKVLFNEDVLATGAAVYAKVAMDWLAEH